MQVGRRPNGQAARRNSISTRTYERPRTAHRRDRRDRRLQDRGPGEPAGAGRGRRHGGDDPLGHAAGRPQDVRGPDRPAGGHCDVFGPGAHPHIELAEKAELLCVAPATANILAKAACGLADDLLSTLLLAFDGPVLMAPAMNSAMWEKPAVQRNVAQLRADGVVLIDPEEGYLSCGTRGPGRMAEPETIFRAIAEALEAVE